MMISMTCKLMDLPYLLVKEESVSMTAAFYTSLYEMSPIKFTCIPLKLMGTGMCKKSTERKSSFKSLK